MGCERRTGGLGVGEAAGRAAFWGAPEPAGDVPGALASATLGPVSFGVTGGLALVISRALLGPLGRIARAWAP